MGNSFLFRNLFYPLQLLLGVWFLCSSPVSSQCLEHQKSLLLQLRHELSFDVQTSESDSLFSEADSKLLSWNPATDCYLWDGIECDQTGYVVGLDLSESGINSGINSSSTLFSLLKLRNLNLANNYQHPSPFPTGFYRLLNLTHLNLSNSGFVGQIPLEISLLKNLISLDLSGLPFYEKFSKLNDLELQTLVGNLTRLRVLHLDWIDMSMIDNSGGLHSSLLQLKLLTHLRLNGNNFFQPVPDFLTGFSSLESLELVGGGFFGTFPVEIFLIPTLRVLDASANFNLTGTLPEFVLNSSLQVIRLHETGFTGKLPESVHNLALLEKLEISICSFYGSIPSSFETLTELRHLNFRSNNFTGPIPSLALSKKINTIIFSHNYFTGDIPASYASELNGLEVLDLKNNSLSGAIPLELFAKPSIRRVLLNRNQFTGEFKEFLNMSSSTLIEIDLSENQLQGPIPMSIFNISSLHVLMLNSNQFTGIVALRTLRIINQLTSLDLSDNRISVEVGGTNSTVFSSIGYLGLGSCNLSEFPEFLKNLTWLYDIDLSNNRVNGSIPNWIWDLGNQELGYLNLSNNMLSGFERPGPNLSSSRLTVLDLHSNLLQGSFLLPPPFATVLDYSSNKLSSSLPYDLSNQLGSALFVSLSHNDFWGEIPMSLCEIQFLEILDLSNNNLNGTVPSCLGFSESLKVLKLRNNKLRGALMQAYGKKCSLRTIDINHNHFEGPLPRSLIRCRDFEVLDLGNNHLYGLFPFWLGNLPTLRVLILHSNNFHGSLHHSYDENDFQMLQIIDLSNNNFSGRIPPRMFRSWKGMTDRTMGSRISQVLRYDYMQLSKLYYQDTVALMNKGLYMQLEKILTIFTCIDLSSNHFDGQIPEILGDLISLYVLNLSNNHFTGHIPSSLGEIKQLGSLDLSSNNLSGKIPPEFVKLTFLSFLNLSHNHLVGKIPVGGQMDTFPTTSFEGNNGLCGPPLSACLDKLPHSPSDSVPYKRLSKNFLGLDMDAVWIGFALGGGFGINVGVIAGCFAAKHILRGRGRRFHRK